MPDGADVEGSNDPAKIKAQQEWERLQKEIGDVYETAKDPKKVEDNWAQVDGTTRGAYGQQEQKPSKPAGTGWSDRLKGKGNG